MRRGRSATKDSRSGDVDGGGLADGHANVVAPLLVHVLQEHHHACTSQQGKLTSNRIESIGISEPESALRETSNNQTEPKQTSNQVSNQAT